LLPLNYGLMEKEEEHIHYMRLLNKEWNEFNFDVTKCDFNYEKRKRY
jgi:hypothetical protein